MKPVPDAPAQTENGGPCTFCQILAREIPASIVWEDAHTLAFLDLRQFHPGHVLIISREHLGDLRNADDATAAAVMHTTARIMRAVGELFENDGLSVWHSAGPGANQEVPHLHFHVHPRHMADDVLRVYPEPPAYPPRKYLDEWAREIRLLIGDPDPAIHDFGAGPETKGKDKTPESPI